MALGHPEPPPNGTLTAESLAPHPALRPYVAEYWQLTGEYGPHEPRAVQLITPCLSAWIVLQLGAPVHVRMEDRAWQERPTGFVRGHFHAPFEVRYAGRFRVAGIRFEPGQVHHFLRVAQKQINDRFVDLHDVFGGHAERLLDRAFACEHLSELAQVFDQALLPLRPETKIFDRRFRAALYLATHDPGTASVKNLAMVACLSPRQLERQFQETLGLSPKYVCRVARYDLFRQLWQRQPDMLLTRLSHEAGYADQAHLIREFRRFTGMTPTDYLTSDHSVEEPFVS